MPKAMTTGGDVAVRIFGSLRIDHVDGTEVLGDSAHDRLLQALLLVAPQPIPTDRLVEILWSDEPPRTSDSALRTHLSVVRKTLAKFAPSLNLERDLRGASITGDLLAIDCVLFEELVVKSRFAENTDARLGALESALALFDRTEIVPTLTDSGLLDRVDRLEALRDEAERIRRQSLVELGRFEQCRLELAQPFANEPAVEGIAEPYIASLLGLGLVSDARLACRANRAALAEVGLDTGQGMQALTRRLFSVDLSHRARGEDDREIPNFLRRSRVHVGRRDTLDRICRRRADESGRIVVVEGGPGFGKTELLGAVAARSQGDGFLVLGAAAVEHGRPFQFVDDLLDPWTDLLANGEIDRIELLFGMLDAAVETRPVVVLLDDMQFGDHASIKLLRRCLFRGIPENVLIVTAIRTSADGSAAQLIRDLSSLSSSSVERLTNFDRAELIELIKDRRPGLKESEIWTLVRRLLRVSEGNPLLAEMLLSPGEAIEAEGRTDLAHLVEGLLERFEPVHLQSIFVASLLGLTFPLAVVSEAADQTPAVVLDSIDAGFKFGLLERRYGTEGRFRHPLIRSALAASMPAQKRATVHRNIALVLERRKADVGAIAVHRAFALMDASNSDEVAAVLELVRNLQAALRWEDATYVIELTLQSLDLQPRLLSPLLEFDLQLLLAKGLDGSAEWGRARDAFRRARVAASGDIGKLAVVAVASGGGSQPIERDLERLDWLRKAFEDLAAEPSVRLEALAEFVYLESLFDVTAEVQALAMKLATMANEVGGEAAAGVAAHGCLVVELSKPDVRRRYEESTNARGLQRFVSPERAGTASLVATASALQLGRLHDAEVARRDLDGLVALRQRPGDLWMMHCVDATLAEWRGEFDSASHHHDVARQLALQHDIADGDASRTLFEVARAVRTGSWTAVLQIVLEYDGVIDRTDDLPAASFEAAVRAGLGDTEGARPFLQQAVSLLSRGPKGVPWLPCLGLAADAAWRIGAFQVQLLRLLEPFSGQFIVAPLIPVAVLGPVDRLRSLLFRSIDDHVEADNARSKWRELCVHSAISGWDPMNNSDRN